MERKGYEPIDKDDRHSMGTIMEEGRYYSEEKGEIFRIKTNPDQQPITPGTIKRQSLCRLASLDVFRGLTVAVSFLL